MPCDDVGGGEGDYRRGAAMECDLYLQVCRVPFPPSGDMEFMVLSGRVVVVVAKIDGVIFIFEELCTAK